MLALTPTPKAGPMLTYLRNTTALDANAVEGELHQARSVKKEPPGVNMLKHAQQARVIRVVSTRLPTIFGVFDLIGFERAKVGTTESETAFVITCGDLQSRAPLLRMHPQCLTGEVLGSLRCDCRGQLELAMASIAEEGSGLVIYEHQKGRGIGLMAKLKAYALQDKGLDTVEANHALGFDADCRDFSFAVAILHDLRRVRLLSNNPQKVQALVNGGIEVIERIACEALPNPYALPYLRTKKKKMGHSLTVM
jgi:GTP cyclohydrolase II